MRNKPYISSELASGGWLFLGLKAFFAAISKSLKNAGIYVDNDSVVIYCVASLASGVFMGQDQDNDEIEQQEAQEEATDAGLELYVGGDDESSAQLSADADDGLDMDLGDDVDLELGAEQPDVDGNQGEEAVDVERNDELDLNVSADDKLEVAQKGEEVAADLAEAENEGQTDSAMQLDNPEGPAAKAHAQQEADSPPPDTAVAEDFEKKMAQLDEMMDESLTPQASLPEEAPTDPQIKIDQQALNSAPGEELSDEDLEKELEQELLAEQETIAADVSSLADELSNGDITKPAATRPPQSLGSITQDVSLVEEKDGELLRLTATLSHVRSEKQQLSALLDQLQDEKEFAIKQVKNLEEQLEEKSIELGILQKGKNRDKQELLGHLEVSEEKRKILQEKNKKLAEQVHHFQVRGKIDLNRIKARENELANKLELLRQDTQVQIQNRDKKILDLKRKIDLLEFDLEAMSIKESKAMEDRDEALKKLENLQNILRQSVSFLDGDEPLLNFFSEEKKKLIG